MQCHGHTIEAESRNLFLKFYVLVKLSYKTIIYYKQILLILKRNILIGYFTPKWNIPIVCAAPAAAFALEYLQIFTIPLKCLPVFILGRENIGGGAIVG